MNNEEEKKLDQLLSRLPRPQYNMDKWLMEDETAEFDRIVSKHRRKVWWWGVAAAVVGMLCVAGALTNWRAEEAQPVATHTVKRNAPVPRPAFEENGQQFAAIAPPPKQTGEQGKAVRPTMRHMTPVDSLADIVAHIEQMMQGVRDSCYIANVEKLILTDERLQRLVNQLILEGIIADTTMRTALTDLQDNNH